MFQKLHLLPTFLLVLICQHLFAQDPLINILEKELTREFTEFKKQDIPAYYIAYRVSDMDVVDIVGSHGCLESNRRTTNRILTPMVRIGTPERDNFHPMRGSNGFSYLGITELPLENNELAISQSIWQATNTSYQNAVTQYGRIKGSTANNAAEEDKSPDFSNVQPEKYIEPAKKIVIDKKLEDILVGKAMKLSAPFYNNIYAVSSSVRYSINSFRKYFIDTDGTRIAENRNYVELSIECNGFAKDGMDLPQYKSYFASSINELPSDEEIQGEVKRMINTLIAMRKSPVVEAYTGPALLSGSATGVFFHEIFGHRIEASRMKTVDDAQTYKKKVGEQVLNPALSVIFDPTLTKYKGFSMNGSYKYDDEGVMGKRTVVVEDGILKDFLTNRTPIDGFMQSNGHGRAMEAAMPVSRQSNLILESKKHYTEKELRELFMAELKKQNLEFGYFFKEVSGGFTTRNRYNPNAFNITPTEVYRVYTDGRPDELVRGVNLVGTPLAIFSEVEAIGGDYGLFNGYCGAESGPVPVSSVCPMMFVKKIELQKKPIPAGNTPPIDMPN